MSPDCPGAFIASESSQSRDKLAHSESLEQLRQRVIATHHLEPMDADEVESYLTHRLKVVGWNGRPSLEPDAFAAIYENTGGVPRRVNQLAGRVLLHVSVEGTERIDAEAVRAVADDMAADIARGHGGTLRSVSPAAAEGDAARATMLERQVAGLETRLDEQERALRRVLTLLIDWVERDTEVRHEDAA